MPFCTMVEWDEDFSSDQVAKLTETAKELPDGCLCRIVGSPGKGAKVIEIWQSAGHAQKHAHASTASVAAMPPPDRISAFETTTYLTA